MVPTFEDITAATANFSPSDVRSHVMFRFNSQETVALQEIDIWRTAKVLIDAHGESAWLEAAQRADHCLEAGNSNGATVWKQVLKAVEDLQRQKSVGDPLH
jgi:hypothetical protein